MIAACKEVLGQSAASKMKDIPLSNDTVERWISGMAEDTEKQIIKKKIVFICIKTGRNSRYSEKQIFFTYVRYNDHDESDMKEDILSVSELLTHTINSEIFKVLNGPIEDRGVDWK